MQMSSLNPLFAAQCIKILALICKKKKNLFVVRILGREPDPSFH